MEMSIEITAINHENGLWFAGNCIAVQLPSEKFPAFLDEINISGEPSIPMKIGYPYLVDAKMVDYRGRPQIKIDKGCIPRVLLSMATIDGKEAYLFSVKRTIDEYRKEMELSPLLVGNARIKALFKAFGDKSIEVLRDSPDDAAKSCPKWSREAIDYFSEYLKTQKSREAAYLEMFDIRENSEAAISPKQIDEFINTYSSTVPKQLKTNPYQFVSKVSRFGFSSADKMALKAFGWSESQPSRILASCQEVLRQEGRNGHSWTYRKKVAEKATLLIGQDNSQMTEMLIPLDPRLEIVSGERAEEIYLKQVREAEVETANYFRPENQANPNLILTKEDKLMSVTLNADQQKAYNLGMSRCDMVLTGGPGRGKTHTVGIIVKGLQKRGRKVLLLAPTGKAALRMREMCPVKVMVSTIHRYLYQRAYEYFEDIIVDECSMIDIALLAWLIRSLQKNQSIIMVGDVDQLPPISCGKPFSEIIESESIPIIKLEKVMRTDRIGLIEAAEIVNNGDSCAKLANTEESFVWIRPEPKNYNGDIIKYVKGLLKHGIKGPSIQIICALNRTIDVLNPLLSALLNPLGEKIEASASGQSLKIDDRVMCLKNSYKMESRQGKSRFYTVMNGEQGKVIGLDINEDNKKKNRLIIDFGLGRIVGLHTTENKLRVCYAATCHKYQGSEADHVIVSFSRGSQKVVDKSWIYTAITRAKYTCLLVASEESVKKHLSSPARIENRRSGLLELLNNNKEK